MLLFLYPQGAFCQFIKLVKVKKPFALAGAQCGLMHAAIAAGLERGLRPVAFQDPMSYNFDSVHPYPPLTSCGPSECCEYPSEPPLT